MPLRLSSPAEMVLVSINQRPSVVRTFPRVPLLASLVPSCECPQVLEDSEICVYGVRIPRGVTEIRDTTYVGISLTDGRRTEIEIRASGLSEVTLPKGITTCNISIDRALS